MKFPRALFKWLAVGYRPDCGAVENCDGIISDIQLYSRNFSF